MHVYRVFAYQDTAAAGESGHPLFLFKPQGGGRSDNPRSYDTWYFAADPEGAIAEVLGNLLEWKPEAFVPGYLPTGRYAVGRFWIPDTLGWMDFDNGRNLFDRAIRPREVIERNRPNTQAISLRVFEERNAVDGSRKWDGVKWWSYHHPQWTVYALWVAPGEPIRHEYVDCIELHPDTHAVIAAARSLNKRIVTARK